MASGSRLADISRASWRKVARVCEGAAVFLDETAGELLHWAGGLQLLGQCVGCYDLYKDLNAVARDFIAEAPYCHVVIVVTSLLRGSCSEKVAGLLSSLQPLECHLFCSRSEAMHEEAVPLGGMEGEGEGEGGYSHYGEFQALMRKWINREAGVRVSVSHLSLFHAEVCPGLAVTPPHHSLFPLLPSCLPLLRDKLAAEETEEDGGDEVGGELGGGASVSGLLSRLVRLQLASADPRPRPSGDPRPRPSGDPRPRLSLEELLGLSVCLSSLDGWVQGGAQEQRLKELLVELVMCHRECDREMLITLGMGENVCSEERAHKCVEEVFRHLCGVRSARYGCRQFHSISSTDGYQPLLVQLVDSIFNPLRPELPDLRHQAQGLTGMLKSGFSLFMSSARPRPSDHPLLVLFVVGGVTCWEVRRLREVLAAHHTKVQVLVCSTRLLTASAATRLVLTSHNTFL